MSFPNIPDINPDITIDRIDVINLLLASIAFEELGLAHILNAEGEKIQSVLGTLPGQTSRTVAISDLIAIDSSVDKILKDVIKKEMLLQFKLEDVLELLSKPAIHKNVAKVTAVFDGITVQDTDTAYYQTAA